MNQLVTQGIILSRTDFGEADRIITLLTPDHGKLRLMARGVRKVKSKLAGGIELFSVSHITFIRGRGDMGTLVSTRLSRHYGRIVTDIERVQLGYDLIKTLNRATEDEPEADYFHLLQGTFEALDDTVVATGLIGLWFGAQLLRLAGHSPNLKTDSAGQPLSPEGSYDFNFDDMAFVPHSDGRLGADHIKFLRLVFGGNSPQVLQKIQNVDELVQASAPLVHTMLRSHIRI